MKSKSLYIVLIILILLSTSCSIGKENNDKVKLPVDVKLTQTDQLEQPYSQYQPHFYQPLNGKIMNRRSYEDWSELYPDKYILRYVNDIIVLKDEVLDEINRYLVEKGSAYVIWMDYSNNVKQYIEEG